MSAAFTICGFLIGLMSARVSAVEPDWAWLSLPAGAAFIVGLLEQDRRS